MIKIMEYGQVARDEIFARQESAVDVSAIVSDIIEKVRTGGDRVVLEYCKQFDKAELSALEALLLWSLKFLPNTQMNLPWKAG